MSNPQTLRATILCDKYTKSGGANFDMARYDRSSALWKGIMKSAPNLKLTTLLSIGNGTMVSFYNQNLIQPFNYLANHAISPLDNNTLSKPVVDCVKDGSWNEEKLNAVLSPDIVQRILGIHPPCEGVGLIFVVGS